MIVYIIVSVLVGASAFKSNEFDPCDKTNDLEKLSDRVDSLTKHVNSITKDVARLLDIVQEEQKLQKLDEKELLIHEPQPKNNKSLEERVADLENQMALVNEVLTEITRNVEDLDQQAEITQAEIVLIKSEQVLQDQKLLELEGDNEVLEANIQEVENSVILLEKSDAELNSAVQNLDSQLDQITGTVNENVVAISNLQETVTGLQQTDETHSADITELMSDIITLTGSVNEINTRLDKLDLDGTVAFHVDLGAYSSITIGSVIVYPDVWVNLGNGYNKETGDFTVPSGGAGLYFVYAAFSYNVGHQATFLIESTDGIVCTVNEDETNGGDSAAGSCGAVLVLQEGLYLCS